MLNGRHRANLLTGHANNIAGSVFSNGVEGRGEPRILWANRNTCAAFNAGIPINTK